MDKNEYKPKVGETVYCIDLKRILIQPVFMCLKYSFLVMPYYDHYREYIFTDYNKTWFTDLSKAKQQLLTKFNANNSNYKIERINNNELMLKTISPSFIEEVSELSSLIKSHLNNSIQPIQMSQEAIERLARGLIYAGYHQTNNERFIDTEEYFIDQDDENFFNDSEKTRYIICRKVPEKEISDFADTFDEAIFKLNKLKRTKQKTKLKSTIYALTDKELGLKVD